VTAVCVSCGQSSPSGLNFCGACGARLEQTCESCGASSPASFSFCGSCGASFEPEQAPAPEEPSLTQGAEEERKVATVVFADLEASTELASRLDPEDLRAVLGSYFAAMTEEIERHGGTVEKFIGDAVVGVFGAPVAHEDDPARAVQAALAMQARLPALNAQVAGRAGGDLALRIGVNTGDVLAAHRAEHEGYVVGEPVNVAARLQSLAQAGSIIVGERTWRSTRSAIAYRRLAAATLKGVRDPVVAWEVVPDGRADPDSRVSRAPLVGRDEELVMLRVLLDQTMKEGRPNLATIVGPPGIGKSRLAWTFAEEARLRGVRVLAGRCPPYGAGLAYWPLGEVLKSDAGMLESDPPDVVLAKADRQLGPRFEAVDVDVGIVSVLLSSIGVVPTVDPLAGAERTAAKRLIASAWRRYFETLSETEPLVLLIEDIHWADGELLELIQSFAERLRGEVLTLCTARPDLWQRRTPWAAGLPTTTITLTPLSTAEATALVDGILGGRIPGEVARRIVERAEGNPFFASELLLMMAEDGTLARRGETWELTGELPSVLPDTVQAVISSRIDLLPPEQKRAIQDAAVVGRTFWPGAVARVGSPNAEAALDALIDAGLVWEREVSTFAGERELMFNHILTRDGAYASVPRARRVEAHAAVITWIEQNTPGREEELAEILSYHAREAADGDRSARYALLAGHRHRRVFDADAAIRWYDEALAAIETLPPGEAALLRAETALSRGEAHEQLGQYGEARNDYQLALEATRVPGHERPWLEAKALAALVEAYCHEDRHAEADGLLPEALQVAETIRADDATTKLLFAAGSIATAKGDSRDALALHVRALEVAQHAQDRESEALARQAIAETRLAIGGFEEGLREAKIADRLLRQLGRRPLLHRNEHVLAWHLWLSGNAPDAAAVAASSASGSRELGNPRVEGAALIVLGLAELSTGNLADATRALDDAVRLAHAARAPRLEQTARLWRALVLLEVGAVERLAAENRALTELSGEVSEHHQRAARLAVAASCACVDGDLDAARAAFDNAATLAAGAPLELLFVARLELLTFELAEDAVGIQAAEQCLHRLAALGAPVSAWSTFCAAYANLLRGDAQGAAEGARDALALTHAAPEVPLEWRARLMLARASGDETQLQAAASILSPMAADLAQELRSAFLARPDVMLALAPA